MIDTYVRWNLCLVSIALAITVTITLPDGPQQKATTLSHNSDDDDALCTLYASLQKRRLSNLKCALITINPFLRTSFNYIFIEEKEIFAVVK